MVVFEKTRRRRQKARGTRSAGMLARWPAFAAATDKGQRTVRQRIGRKVDTKRGRNRLVRKAERHRRQHVQCKQCSAYQPIATELTHGATFTTR